MEFDDIAVGKRLFVGIGAPIILGVGPLEVRGSSYIEGPQIVGDPSAFSAPVPTELGTLMLGQATNPDMKPPPFYQLVVQTFARVKGFLKVDQLISVPFIKSKICYAEIFCGGTKNFVIDHPTKKDYKLWHGSLEGPEVGVYYRGRLTSKNVIELPDYWTGLVHEDTITVSLTPIGAHQDIIVKRVGQNQVHLQAKGNMPIDCYYHVYGERKDVEKLQVEVAN